MYQDLVVLAFLAAGAVFACSLAAGKGNFCAGFCALAALALVVATGVAAALSSGATGLTTACLVVAGLVVAGLALARLAAGATAFAVAVGLVCGAGLGVSLAAALTPVLLMGVALVVLLALADCGVGLSEGTAAVVAGCTDLVTAFLDAAFGLGAVLAAVLVSAVSRDSWLTEPGAGAGFATAGAGVISISVTRSSAIGTSVVVACTWVFKGLLTVILRVSGIRLAGTLNTVLL